MPLPFGVVYHVVEDGLLLVMPFCLSFSRPARTAAGLLLPFAVLATLLGGCVSSHTQAPAAPSAPAPAEQNSAPAAPAQQPATEQPSPPPPLPIIVAAVGDIMLGSAWPDTRDLPPSDAKNLLAPAASVLQNADLAFGNLEGPLVDGGRPTKRGGPHSFAFAVPTRYGVRLQEAGFDLLSLANNHASDFGARGRASTRRVLDNLGIAHAGDKGTVAFRDVRGRRVALVAFAHNKVAHNVNDVANARRVVAALVGRADIVLVSFHGGGEGSGRQHVPRGPETYLGEARGDLRKFAHAVVDAGADLVLGHGPHVVRGMEVYRGRLIAYSLGNFATYGKFGLSGPTSYAPILEAHLDAQTGAFRGGFVHAFRQTKPGGPRPDPQRAVVPVLRRLGKQDFGAGAVQIADDGALLAAPETTHGGAGLNRPNPVLQ